MSPSRSLRHVRRRNRFAAVLAIVILAPAGFACGEKKEPDLSTVPQTETVPTTTAPTSSTPTPTAPAP